MSYLFIYLCVRVIQLRVLLVCCRRTVGVVVRSEQAVVAHACHGHRYRPSPFPLSGTGGGGGGGWGGKSKGLAGTRESDRNR